MTKNISFINSLELTHYHPCPAKQELPEWYKNQESYIGGQKKPEFPEGTTPSTIKKCIPVLDSLTSGYFIKTHVDIYVTKNESGSTFFQWRDFNAISFQTFEQVGNHPNNDGYDMPKFNNPWGIKTSKGYSTLFMAPMNRKNIITILPAVVDTDSYYNPVSLPFKLSDENFEGMIPAGTIIAQVVPFKRESWQMSISEDKKQIYSVKTLLNSVWFDGYKRFFWFKKEYN